ncbi:UNVERIFIED_CONTAM: hypothetical protein Sangu_1617400 [Sesamum angustifolium]|uniref:Uncharacterized protein n=1 Tax=Sesamum angustifolium TaxID=2727405 RepID=A0AAW2MGU0_9LAMI
MAQLARNAGRVLSQTTPYHHRSALASIHTHPPFSRRFLFLRPDALLFGPSSFDLVARRDI